MQAPQVWVSETREDVASSVQSLAIQLSHSTRISLRYLSTLQATVVTYHDPITHENPSAWKASYRKFAILTEKDVLFVAKDGFYSEVAQQV